MGMRIRRPKRNSTPGAHSGCGAGGFSLLEMVIVISLILIVTGYAVINLQGAVRDSHVNGAFDNVFMQLRLARERAIAERKRYIVTFGSPAPPLVATPLGAPNAKSIQVYRWDTGIPTSPAPTQVATVDLPTDVSFQAISGIPTGSSAVPDGWGSGVAAIDFDQGVGAGSGNLVMFMPDGSAHDLAGNANSGIIYMARNGDLYSSRAVTVFGTTGRLRAWRLMLISGVKTWVQQ